MRSVECLGLQWNDIDFENRKIYIHHTLPDVGGNHFLTTPKTETSIHYHHMSDNLIVSEHLGHSDTAVTADIYTAVLDNSRIKTANTIDEILSEQTPNKHQMLGLG